MITIKDTPCTPVFQPFEITIKIGNEEDAAKWGSFFNSIPIDAVLRGLQMIPTNFIHQLKQRCAITDYLLYIKTALEQNL